MVRRLLNNNIKLMYLGDFSKEKIRQDFIELQANTYSKYIDTHSFLSSFYLDVLKYNTLVIIGSFSNEISNPINVIKENIGVIFPEEDVYSTFFESGAIVFGGYIKVGNTNIFLTSKEGKEKVFSIIKEERKNPLLYNENDKTSENLEYKETLANSNESEDLLKSIDNIDVNIDDAVLNTILDNIFDSNLNTTTNNASVHKKANIVKEQSVKEQSDADNHINKKINNSYNTRSYNNDIYNNDINVDSQQNNNNKVNKKNRSNIKKKKSMKVRYFILITCIIAFLLAGVYLIYNQLIEPAIVNSNNEKILKIYEDGLDNSSQNLNENSDSSENQDNKEKEDLKSNNKKSNNGITTLDTYSQLVDINTDLVGWINIPSTNINYPVVQSKDNTHYLNHDFYGDFNRYGAIYADYESILTNEKTGENISIYGHNMLNESMFGQLKYYKDIEFLKKNPYIYFSSLNDSGVYVIYSVFITNSKASEDNGHVFEWRVPEFTNEKEYNGYVSECKKRSLYNIPIEVANDDLLNLSTCSYEFKDARLVIAAKKVSNANNIPSFNGITYNKEPLYPQAWYDVTGKIKPN